MLLIPFPNLVIFGSPQLTTNFQKPLLQSKLSIQAPKRFVNGRKVSKIPFLVTNQAKIAQEVVYTQSKNFKVVLESCKINDLTNNLG